MYNILNHLLFTNDKNKILKVAGIGTGAYILLYCLLFTKYASKIPYNDMIKKYFFYAVLIDLSSMLLLNRNAIVATVKSKIKNQNKIELNSIDENNNDSGNDDDTENVQLSLMNPFNKVKSIENKELQQDCNNNNNNNIVECNSLFQKISNETESDVKLPIYKSKYE